MSADEFPIIVEDFWVEVTYFAKGTTRPFRPPVPVTQTLRLDRIDYVSVQGRVDDGPELAAWLTEFNRWQDGGRIGPDPVPPPPTSWTVVIGNATLRNEWSGYTKDDAEAIAEKLRVCIGKARDRPVPRGRRRARVTLDGPMCVDDRPARLRRLTDLLAEADRELTALYQAGVRVGGAATTTVRNLAEDAALAADAIERPPEPTRARGRMRGDGMPNDDVEGV